MQFYEYFLKTSYAIGAHVCFKNWNLRYHTIGKKIRKLTAENYLQKGTEIVS